MSLTPGLLRLRLAFLGLGVSLIASVSALAYSALSRLEEQRSLRQRTVAERVFDEVEREIGTVLQHEAERPSAAYAASDTEPSRWSRFVVGYYRRDPELSLVAEASLGTERSSLLRALIAAADEPLAAARLLTLGLAAASSPSPARTTRAPTCCAASTAA